MELSYIWIGYTVKTRQYSLLPKANCYHRLSPGITLIRRFNQQVTHYLGCKTLPEKKACFLKEKKITKFIFDESQTLIVEVVRETSLVSFI